MLEEHGYQRRDDFFYDIVCHKAGRYRGLQGTRSGSSRRPTVSPIWGSDFVVDPEALRACLSWLHAPGTLL